MQKKYTIFSITVTALVVVFLLTTGAFYFSNIKDNTDVIGSVGTDPNYPSRMDAILEEMDLIFEKIQNSENSTGLLSDLIEVTMTANCENIVALCRHSEDRESVPGASGLGSVSIRKCEPVISSSTVDDFWEEEFPGAGGGVGGAGGAGGVGGAGGGDEAGGREEFLALQEDLRKNKERLQFIQNIIKKEMRPGGSIPLELERMREEGREDEADSLELELGVILYLLDPDDAEVRNNIITIEARVEGDSIIGGRDSILDILGSYDSLLPSAALCTPECKMPDSLEVCASIGAEQADFIMSFGLNITFKNVNIDPVTVTGVEFNFPPKINIPDPEITYNVPIPDMVIRYPVYSASIMNWGVQTNIDIDPIIVPSLKMTRPPSFSLDLPCPEFNDGHLLPPNAYAGTYAMTDRIDTISLDWSLQMFDYLARSCREIPSYLAAERKCDALFIDLGPYRTALQRCEDLADRWGDEGDRALMTDGERRLLFESCVDLVVIATTFEICEREDSLQRRKCPEPCDDGLHDSCFYILRKLRKVGGVTTDPACIAEQEKRFVGIPYDENLLASCFDGEYRLACIAALEERGKGEMINVTADDICADRSDEVFGRAYSDMHEADMPVGAVASLGAFCTNVHDNPDREEYGGFFTDQQTMIEVDCLNTSTVINRIKEDCQTIWSRYTETWMFLSVFRDMYETTTLIVTKRNYIDWWYTMRHLDEYFLGNAGANGGPRRFWDDLINNDDELDKVFLPFEWCGCPLVSGQVIADANWFRRNFNNPSVFSWVNVWEDIEVPDPDCDEEELEEDEECGTIIITVDRGHYYPWEPPSSVWLPGAPRAGRGIETWWQSFPTNRMNPGWPRQYNRVTVITLRRAVQKFWLEWPPVSVSGPNQDRFARNNAREDINRQILRHFLDDMPNFKTFVYSYGDWIMFFDYIDEREAWADFLAYLNGRYHLATSIVDDSDVAIFDGIDHDFVKSPGDAGLYAFYEYLDRSNVLLVSRNNFRLWKNTRPNLKKILLPPKICQEIGIEPAIITARASSRPSLSMFDQPWQEYIMRDQYMTDFYVEFFSRLNAKKYKVRGSIEEDVFDDIIVTFFNSFGSLLFLWENDLLGEKTVEPPFSRFYSSTLSIPDSYERCRAEGGTALACEPLIVPQENFENEQNLLFNVLRSGGGAGVMDPVRFLHFVENYENFRDYTDFLGIPWSEYVDLLVDIGGHNLAREYSDYASTNNWTAYRDFMDEETLWDEFNAWSMDSFEEDFFDFLISESDINLFYSYINRGSNNYLLYDVFQFLTEEKSYAEELRDFIGTQDNLYYRYLEFLGRHDESGIKKLTDLYTRSFLGVRQVISDSPTIWTRWADYYANEYTRYDISGDEILELPYEKTPPFLPFARQVSEDIADEVCRVFEEAMREDTPGPLRDAACPSGGGADFPNRASCISQNWLYGGYYNLYTLADPEDGEDDDYPRSIDEVDFNELCDKTWDSLAVQNQAMIRDVNNQWRVITVDSEELREALRGHSGNQHKNTLEMFLEFLTLNDLMERFHWIAKQHWYYLHLTESLAFLEEKGLFDTFIQYVDNAATGPVPNRLPAFNAPLQIKPFTGVDLEVCRHEPDPVTGALVWVCDMAKRDSNQLIHRDYDDTIPNTKTAMIRAAYVNFAEMTLVRYANTYHGPTIWGLLEKGIYNKYRLIGKYNDWRWRIINMFSQRLYFDMQSIYRKLGSREYRRPWTGKSVPDEFTTLDLVGLKTRRLTTTSEYLAGFVVVSVVDVILPVPIYLFDILFNLGVTDRIASWFQTRFAILNPAQDVWLRMITVFKKLTPAFTEQRSIERACQYLYLSVGTTPPASCSTNPINTMENKCRQILDEEIRRKEANPEDRRRATVPLQCILLATFNESGAMASLLSGYSDAIGGYEIADLFLYMNRVDHPIGSYPRFGMLGCPSPSLSLSTRDITVPDISIPKIPLSRFNIEIQDIETPDFKFMPFFDIKLPNFYFEDLTFPDIELCDLSDCQQFLDLFPSIFDMFPNLQNILIPMPEIGIRDIELDPIKVEVHVAGGIRVTWLGLPNISFESFRPPSFRLDIPQLMDLNSFSLATFLYELPDPDSFKIETPEIEFEFYGLDADFASILVGLILNYFGISVPNVAGCAAVSWSFIPIIIKFEDYYISWPDIPKVPELEVCRDLNSFCRSAGESLEDMMEKFKDFIEDIEKGIIDTFTLPATAAAEIERRINDEIALLEIEINTALQGRTFSGTEKDGKVTIEQIKIPIRDIEVQFNLSDLYDGGFPLSNEIEIYNDLAERRVLIPLNPPFEIEIPPIPLENLNRDFIYDVNLPGYQSIVLDIEITAGTKCERENYSIDLPFFGFGAGFDWEASDEDERREAVEGSLDWDDFSDQRDEIKNKLREIISGVR